MQFFSFNGYFIENICFDLEQLQSIVWQRFFSAIISSSFPKHIVCFANDIVDIVKSLHVENFIRFKV